MVRMNFHSDPLKRFHLAIACAMLLMILSLVFAPKSQHGRTPKSTKSTAFQTDKPIVKRMKVTAYCPCVLCCGSDGTAAGSLKALFGVGMGSGICADGSPARHGVIAADPKYRFGTTMKVPGYHPAAIVCDRGSAIQGDRIDVFFDSHERAKKWGVQYLDVTIHPTIQKPPPKTSAPVIPPFTADTTKRKDAP